jgi:uncharacterized protein (DUF885 family)
VSDLDVLIDRFLGHEMSQAPTRATSLGIDGYDDQLGAFAGADFARRARQDKEWLARFEEVPAAGLSLDERIDRDLVVSTLRGRAIMHDWESWRRDPATYVQPGLAGVFSLFLNRLHPEPDLVRFAAARLRAVPEVLACGRKNLHPDLAHPLIVKRALGSCQAGVRYARELLPLEVDDAALRQELADAGASAAAAYEEFAPFLEELAGKADGEWSIGESRYSALLMDKEMLGYGAQTMLERGWQAYNEISAAMSALARDIAGTDDWQAVVQDLNRDHPASPEAMRQEYERWTELSRQFLHETGIVSMPEGEECRVVASPPFQRPVLAVASYSSPPAFKPGLIGHFFVPFPPDGVSDEEVQKRLETNSFHTIPAVTVHEAYPGHHWHLATVHGHPRPIRKVFGTSYFTEGWALYAEMLMRDHDFFSDPRHVLCQLDARIFRAARIIVDTSLHMGEMTVEEAVEFMSSKASLSEPTARAEVGRYCAWPTQAASYLTGCLEIERMRDAYLAAGKGDIRSFNDTIAGSGMLPIGLAEQVVMA